MYLNIFARHLPHSSDHFHASLHFCKTSSTLIRPLPCTFTFLHDIFHTHQTISMHLYISAQPLPQSSDHFHTTLHFCTTSSTLIRPLSCIITFLHDIFHTHQTASMYLYIFTPHLPHSSDNCGRCRAKMFQGAWKLSDECGSCRAKSSKGVSEVV